MLRLWPFRRNDESLTLLEDGPSKENLLPYILASFLVCQISLATGLSQGYSAILLFQLQQPDSPICINDDIASWIASLGTICRPIGSLIDGYVIDKIGRKRTMQAMLIVITASWILTIFSNGIFMIYLSRIMMSLVLGMTASVSIYLNEISKATYRGTLMSLIEPFVTIGTFFVYILGYTFSWQWVAILLTFHGILVFLLIFFIPESFVWCLANGKKTKAIESLVWFRGTNIEQELRALENRLKSEEKKNNSYSYVFKNVRLRNRLFMFVGFTILQQILGYTILTYYANSFYNNLGTPYDAGVLTIIQGALSTVASFTMLAIIHRFKRKTLLVSSALGMVMAMSLAALTFVVEGISKTITLIGIFTYVWFTKMGIVSVPYVVIGESFPTRGRAAATAITNVISYTISFLTIKSYPFANRLFGIEVVLIYLACIPFVLVLYLVAFFPETKDRTLIEMEDDS